MTHNKETLIKKIEALKGVSEDCKPGIRDLVAEITGVDLSTPTPTYKSGQRFRYHNRIRPLANYMLVRIGASGILAANLKTGYTRTQEAVQVRNTHKITEDELGVIFGNGLEQIIVPI